MIYSGFWRRFVALIIDGVVLTVPLYTLMFLLLFPAMSSDLLTKLSPEEIENMDQEQVTQLMVELFSSLTPRILLSGLLFILIPWLYYAALESSSLQATLGKLAMGSIVTDLDGERITFLRATGRHFGKIISNLILMIGFLMAAFTERKQALHDMLAGCLVIQKGSSIRPLYDLPE
jgi:uncharacterized RDD family membrane protein YckC